MEVLRHLSSTHQNRRRILLDTYANLILKDQSHIQDQFLLKQYQKEKIEIKYMRQMSPEHYTPAHITILMQGDQSQKHIWRYL